MSRDYPTPATPVKLRPPQAGVSAPLCGLALPPSWTRTDRARLWLAQRLHGAAEALADMACLVAPGWRR